jgi:hypothetical protein
MSTNTINRKAMIVKLRISEWKGGKKDHTATQATHTHFHAMDNSGEYRKFLISKDALKEIQQVAGRMRNYVLDNTLPWNDGGVRLLPTKHFMEFCGKIREMRSEFEMATLEFINKYPSLILRAQKDLGGLFNPNEYPTVDEIRERFSVDLKFKPVAVADDFRVEMDEEEVERIKADISENVQRDMVAANQELWKRLYEVVNYTAERLSADRVDKKTGEKKPPIFRDTLVENAKEIVRILPRLNITGDQDLENMRQEVEAKLTVFTPGQLRDNPAIRAQVAKDAEAISNKMNGYMGGVSIQ